MSGPDSKPKRDELGDFLTKYSEYLAGNRSYSDLPVLGDATGTDARPASAPAPKKK